MLRRIVRTSQHGTGMHRQWPAEQKVDLVDVVDQEIDGHTSRYSGIGHPLVPVGRCRQTQGADDLRRADGASRDLTHELLILGPKAQYESEQQFATTRIARRDNRLSVFDRQGNRLLKQNVTTGRERRLGYRTMERRRQADVDNLDVIACQRCEQVVRGLGPADLGDLGRPLDRPRGDDANLGSIRMLRPSGGMRTGHKARAENRDADHPSPSALRCTRERAIASVTSASGGHGSP